MRKRVQDIDKVVQKCCTFILEKHEEQRENFRTGKGDIYQKYLYHCTPRASEDNYKKFVERSCMFITENEVSNYADWDDLDIIIPEVKSRIEGKIEKW